MNSSRGKTNPTQQWIVKNKKNQTRGPYSTFEVMNYISEGVFSGEEFIAQYPSGNWVVMSSLPQFYDKILQALEKQTQNKNQPSKQNLSNNETVIIPPPVSSQRKEKPNFEKTHSSHQPHQGEIKGGDTLTLPKNETKKSRLVIDLKKFGPLNRKQVFEKLKLPLLAVIFVTLSIGLLLYLESDSSEDKIHLLAPAKNGEPLNEKQVKERVQLAVRAIEKDNFESYVEAQNLLVSAIEGSPRSLEPRSLLCFVYKELWPFAKQDSQDLRTIDQVVQSTKTINLVDPHGTLCEVVKMLTAGRLKEARGSTDSLLELGEQFSLYPLLFEIKAEILESEKEYTTAIPYFEKVTQLWAPWVKPKSMLGWTYYNSSNPTQAAQYFNAALRNQPRHKNSLIGLGVVEFKAFNQNEIAFNHLIAGLESSGKIPRNIESEGLESLAEIYILKNKKSAAQKAACRSLEISPGRKSAKELCARLGGKIESNRKNLYIERIFLGDQQMRSGNCLAAQAEYKAAFELQPNSAEAAVKAAKCLWTLNQSSEAIDWLTKAIQADPKMISSYSLQADYMSQRYDFSHADQALSIAARLAPNNYEVFRTMALVAFRKNDYQTAITYGMRSLKAYDGDSATYIILSNSSRELAARIRPAEEKEREKKDNLVKDSLKFATKAVELDATNPEAQSTFAKTLASTSGVESGINYANELVKRYAYSSEYRITLAEILMNEERYRQASEVLEQVITFENKNKKALLPLGYCYKSLGMIDQALSTYLKAAVIDPTDAEPIFQAGKIYLDAGKFDEALQQFQRVLKINPFYPRTYYFLAKTSFAAGNLNEALEQANQEKKIYPRLSDAYILSAEIHSARLKYADCAAEYSKAIGLNQQGADIYVKAARCYRLTGSLDLAEDMLALARDRESGYAEIFREQGAIFQSRGKNAEAIRAYEMYLELSPNALDKNEVQGQITKLGG